jgi:predicted nucleotide-binding protein
LEQARQRIAGLVAQGESFTYENFATKGLYGYPDSFVPTWLAWQARVKSAIVKLLGPESASMDMLKSGFEVRLLGNGPDKFNLAKSYFLGALTAALDVLKEDTFAELRTAGASAPKEYSTKVFIVHGHDEKSRMELEALLTEMGLQPVVLHRQPDQGQTIIEKFEAHADVGYAFVVLTPDEIAYLVAQDKQPDSERVKERRARPNVIFEFGYFVGRLGRPRVCCLYTGSVILPSDINGLLYKKFNESIEDVAYAIRRELQAAGYQVK